MHQFLHKVQLSPILTPYFDFLPKEGVLPRVLSLAFKSIGALVLVSKDWNEHAISLFSTHKVDELHRSIALIQQLSQTYFPAMSHLQLSVTPILPPKSLFELRLTITNLMRTQVQLLQAILSLEDLQSLSNSVKVSDPEFVYEIIVCAIALESDPRVGNLLYLRSLSPNFLASAFASDMEKTSKLVCWDHEIITYMENLCKAGFHKRALALIPQISKNMLHIGSIILIAIHCGELELAYKMLTPEVRTLYVYTKMAELATEQGRFDILFSLFEDLSNGENLDIDTPIKKMAESGLPHLAIVFIRKFSAPNNIITRMDSMANTAILSGYSDDLLQALHSMEKPENYYTHYIIPAARAFTFYGRSDIALKFTQEVAPTIFS